MLESAINFTLDAARMVGPVGQLIVAEPWEVARQ